MDITGFHGLENVIEDVQERGVRVMLCEANPRVTAKLTRAGIIRMVGEENVFGAIADALAADAVRSNRSGDESGWSAGSPVAQPT